MHDAHVLIMYPPTATEGWTTLNGVALPDPVLVAPLENVWECDPVEVVPYRKTFANAGEGSPPVKSLTFSMSGMRHVPGGLV